MAVTLAQAAALEGSPLRRGTMEMFSQTSAIFDRLPIEPITGAARALRLVRPGSPSGCQPHSSQTPVRGSSRPHVGQDFETWW